VAEDDRLDGSDCDSAVFVSPGNQGRARDLLRATDLHDPAGLGWPADTGCYFPGCTADMASEMCPNDHESCLDHCGEEDH
jgi:hypothetical protein